jgi:hypothetical protein
MEWSWPLFVRITRYDVGWSRAGPSLDARSIAVAAAAQTAVVQPATTPRHIGPVAVTAAATCTTVAVAMAAVTARASTTAATSTAVKSVVANATATVVAATTTAVVAAQPAVVTAATTAHPAEKCTKPPASTESLGLPQARSPPPAPQALRPLPIGPRWLTRVRSPPQLLMMLQVPCDGSRGQLSAEIKPIVRERTFRCLFEWLRTGAAKCVLEMPPQRAQVEAVSGPLVLACGIGAAGLTGVSSSI